MDHADRERELRALSAEFREFVIWRAGDVWLATGPCPDAPCPCRRTWHAPTPEGLRVQLAAAAANRAQVQAETVSADTAIDQLLATIRGVQRRQQ